MNNSILVCHDQYYDMLDKSMRYDALKAAGVDNWEGYNEAMKALYVEHLGEEGAAAKEAAETAVRQPAAVDTEAPAS